MAATLESGGNTTSENKSAVKKMEEPSGSPVSEPVISQPESLPAVPATPRKRSAKKSSSGSSNHGKSSHAEPSSSSRIKHRNSKDKTSSSSGSATPRRHKSKDKVTKNDAHGSTLPPNELTKDRRPNPQVPPQLGAINPLGTSTNLNTTTNDLEDESLRWSCLNSSASTAPTSECTSFAQQSAQTFLLMPGSPAEAEASPTSLLLIARPDTVTNELLKTLQEQPTDFNLNSDIKDQIRQAMNKLVQTATDKGYLVNSAGATAASTTTALANALANTEIQQSMAQMQEELQSHKKLFLEFQKQMLEQQQLQQQQIQQQAEMIERQQKMLELQQEQLLELKNESLQTQQSVRSQRTQRTIPLTPTTPQTSHSTDTENKPPLLTKPKTPRTPSNNKYDSESTKFKEEDAMLDRLKEFEQLEASLQELNASSDHNKGNDKPPTKANRTLHDSFKSIETEYEDDDSDFMSVSKITRENAPQEPLTPHETKEETVEVWTCPQCKFEHEFSRLQFCGVCGAPRPDKNDASSAVSAGSESFSNSTHAKEDDAPSSPHQSGYLPTPPQEPLIQLQLHKELQGGDSAVKDLPPQSPFRKRTQFRRSHSSTDVLRTIPRDSSRGRATENFRASTMTPGRNRSRPRVSADSIQSKQLLRSATYHGSGNHQEDALVVKCLDGGNNGAVFDINILNQQLSTFERSSSGPAGSAPTSSAPKTPKINKRGTFGRSKSMEAAENDSAPVAPPDVFSAKPNIRQAIPRRAKSTSSDQVKMHQIQQFGGGGDALVPPSPATTKRGLLGAAVSAFHKSPKKAITALKLAKNAKSLLGSVHDANNKDKNHAFLLDSDDDDDEPATPQVPATPTQARAAAAEIVNAGTPKTGWKKWLNAGSKHTPTTSLPLNDDEEADAGNADDVDIDIDDSIREDSEDEDLFEDPNQARRRNRRRQPTENRTPSRDGLRRRGSDRALGLRRPGSERDLNGNGLRNARSGSSRNLNRRSEELRQSRHGSPRDSNGRLDDPRSSRYEPTTPRSARHRRGNSLDNPDCAGDSEPGSDSHSNGNKKSGGENGNRDRRGGLNRRNSMQRRPGRVPDDNNDAMKKSDQMKQRMQGLRKSVTEANQKPGHHSQDLSDSTDGCTIYLDDMSTGGMSEITQNML